MNKSASYTSYKSIRRLFLKNIILFIKTNMRNSKIWTIIKREYIAKIKTKGFVISTIVAPIAMIILMTIPALIAYFSLTAEGGSKLKIIIADFSDANIGHKITSSYPGEYDIYEISNENLINIQEVDIQKIEIELKEKILKGEIGGALLLYTDAVIEGRAKILTGESTGLKYITDIKDRVNFILKDRRLKESGISQKTIDLVNANVQFETIKITTSGTSKDDSEILSFLGYLLGFAMYGLIFIYGSQVMQGVLEEKSNRIVEILMSSARPFQIMFGKVVGIGSVGLTQVIFWLLILAGLLVSVGFFVGSDSILLDTIASSSDSVHASVPMESDLLQTLKNTEIPSISPWIFIAFGFYFIAGYFVYATLFAAVGASIDQIQDANSLSMPLTILVIIPIMCIPNVMLNPEGVFATVMSLIPFFTPILMVSRVASISVPIWQILLSIILLVVTFLICLKFAAKVYRIGMLSYGKKPTLKQLARWAVTK